MIPIMMDAGTVAMAYTKVFLIPATKRRSLKASTKFSKPIQSMYLPSLAMDFTFRKLKSVKERMSVATVKD